MSQHHTSHKLISANKPFADGLHRRSHRSKPALQSTTLSGRCYFALAGIAAASLIGMAPVTAQDKTASEAAPQFVTWLYDYIPTQYPDARMTDHTHWLQAHIGDDLVASWAEWSDADSTLKAMEAHNLTPGESVFIEQKGPKRDWADHPAVTHYEGAGYYVSGYDSATMSGWDGKGLSVIQFSGNSEEFARKIALAWADAKSFERWLFRFLPEQYPNAQMIDHGHWLQGKITDELAANWTEWNDADSTLKAMESHGLKEGESVFIEQKGGRKVWADHPAVTYYEGAGYYISEYDSASMGGWDATGLSVIQFDGDSNDLAATIAKAWAATQPVKTSANAGEPLAAWLKEYIPARYPDAAIEDHGGWAQAKVPGGLVVSWAQWNEDGITLKEIEAHALKDGRSIFISKAAKENWAGGPSVVYFDGAGYYIGSYTSASMSGWSVEKSTVIQFDGDSKQFSEEMAKAWVAAN